MRLRIAAALLIFGLSLPSSFASGPTYVKPSAPAAKVSISVQDISFRIQALQALDRLNLSPQQLRTIRAWAASGSVRRYTWPGATISAEYKAVQQALYQATLKNDDIADELQATLNTIEETEELDLNDSVVVTDAARAETPRVMRVLTPNQVASYTAASEDGAPNLITTLIEAAGNVRGTTLDEFNEIASGAGEEVGILVAGIEPAKYGPVAGQVRNWLQRCRALSQTQFAAARSSLALEKSAAGLIGNAGLPGNSDLFSVLQHWFQKDLAELLANPQLVPAIDARLQHPITQAASEDED
jgi:hypothetical protein